MIVPLGLSASPSWATNNGTTKHLKMIHLLLNPSYLTICIWLQELHQAFHLRNLHLPVATRIESAIPDTCVLWIMTLSGSHHCYYHNTDPYSYFHDITLKSHNVLSCSVYKIVPCLLCLAFLSNQLLKPMSFGLAMWSWWPGINVHTPNVMLPKKLATESLASQNVFMS